MDPALSSILSIDVARAALDFDSRESRGVVHTPFAVRLDAVSAGRVLRDFPGPRSREVHEALLGAAIKVADLMGARAVHVVSDEANLIFLDYAPYGGREFKIVSVSAGALSAEVTLRLGKTLFFDARVVRLLSCSDALRYVLYRARVGLGNYVQELARARGVIPREHTPPLATYIDKVSFDLELGAGSLMVKNVVRGRWRGWRRVDWSELVGGNPLCAYEGPVGGPGHTPSNPNVVGHGANPGKQLKHPNHSP